MRNLRNRSGLAPNLASSSITPRLFLVAAALFGVIALVSTHSASGAKSRVAEKFHIAALRDHKRPTTPTGLSVTGSATTISLAWSPSRDNVGVAGYRLYLNNVQVGTTSSTLYTLTGLTCGSSFTVGVSAYDGAGNSSPQATAITATNPCYDALPPSPPTGLTQTSASDTSATVSWTPSTDNVGVVGYGAYVGSLRVDQASQTTYTFTGLRCGQTTSVGLDAADAAGNRSVQTTFFVTTNACVDTQAPSAPSSVTETSATESTISLSWSASSDNVSVAYYKIHVNGATVGTTPQTSYSVSGLACGTSYTVAAEAYDAAGNHSSQGSATLATSACPQAPVSDPQPDAQPPTVPGGLSLQSSTQTSVTLSWTPATDNVGVAGYGAYEDSVRAGQTAQTNYTFTGLSCGTSATFGIDAYDAAGNRSAQASVVASTSSCPDTQAPSQPTGLTLTGRTMSSLSFTWSASTDNVGVAGYDVYEAGTRVGTASSATYTFTGLACGTSYTLGADAYDAAGNRSTQAMATVATSSCPDTQPPSAPTNLSPSGATQTSINLSWTASTDNVGVGGYNVYANGTKVASTTGTSYTVSNLTCGTSYNLAVEAYDSAGNASPKMTLNAQTAACSAAVGTPPPGWGLRPAELWVRPSYSCTGVQLTPSSDVQAAINAAPQGTTFCLGSGAYRLSAAIVAKSNDVLIGQPGTILSGARLLSGFQAGNGYWYVGGQTENAVASYGTCQPTGYLGCRDANDVYFDDNALKRVMTLSELGPGKFYFDHAAQRIYLGSDPAGHKVEVAVTPTAIQGVGVGAYDVTVKGLIVEKFASAPQAAAISVGRGWLIEGVEARLNHAGGIGGATTTRNDYIHDNGESGLGAGCCNIVVDGNEISSNDYAGFCTCWEAGGGKWANGSGLTVTNNSVHDNLGPGLWTDGSENGIVIDGNDVERNSDNGIVIEISYNATVSNNTVIGNGLNAPAGWVQAAGILDNSSPNVEIYNNTVSGNGDGIGLSQANRGSDPTYGPHVLNNDYVHDNTITMTQGHSGLIQYVNDTSYYTKDNNRFVHNTYHLGCTKTNYFIWMGNTSSGYAEMPFSSWQTAGQDTTGAKTALC